MELGDLHKMQVYLTSASPCVAILAIMELGDLLAAHRPPMGRQAYVAILAIMELGDLQNREVSRGYFVLKSQSSL